MEQQQKTRNSGGRPPKMDPAVIRYTINLTAEENLRFLQLFAQSGMHIKAHFITACVFQKTVKTVKVDKAVMDYYMRLTNLYSQFRSVGVNYNQVVKILYRNFSQKKASAFLFKLEKLTAELASLCKQIIELTHEFEAKQLNQNGLL